MGKTEKMPDGNKGSNQQKALTFKLCNIGFNLQQNEK